MVAMLTDQITREVGDVILLPQRRQHVIHVIDGILWVTQAGEMTDILLRAGESKSFHGHGRIAVQPFQGTTTFAVESARGRIGTMLHNLKHPLRTIPRLIRAARRLLPVAPATHPEPAALVPCGRLRC